MVRVFLLIEKDYELSADKFSWMVDDKMYDKLKHNYNECPDNIVKSFVAYRLAHDKIISYQWKFYQNNNIYDRKCLLLIVYIVLFILCMCKVVYVV